MSTTRCLAALFATIVAGAAAQCENFSGDWFDTATEDVMKVTESSCKLTTKYGTATVSGTMVTPADGLLQTIGATGKFNERLGLIEWSNGVKWSKSMTREVERRLTSLESAVQLLQQQMITVSNGTAHPQPPTNSSNTSPASSAEMDDLRKQIETLNSTIKDLNTTGPPGRDGYCTIKPNVTDVYIPVTRYVFRGYGVSASKCTVGGAAARPTGSPGTSMDTQTSITNGNCRWTSYMSQDPVGAYVGDTLVFWRGSDKKRNVYLFDDESAFKDCDFSRAKLKAGLLDFQGLEAKGRNYTFELTESKVYYFGSDKQGAKDAKERKSFCVGGTKIEVNVLEPTEEVMATCPLYDPSKYGIKSGQEIDSASVARLKGAVAAIGRQLIAYEFRIQERVREQGQSGLTIVRSGEQGTDSYHEPSFVGYGAAGMHNHANTHHTIGLGEFGAVLNGVQFTTRHNDYSLKEADHNISLEIFTKTWPPPTRDMLYPDVPPPVLSAGSVSKQVAEMREWFRAWNDQNTTHRDYRPYFKPVLCYLEGAWVNSQEDIAEPFASERHHIDADSWADLNEKTNFYINSGQKNLLENLPYLPTCFRSMNDKGGATDTFEPKTAQWFYRILCKKIDIEIPTARFRVKNEVHVQIRESRPVTREQLAKTNRALFDINPTSEQYFDPKGPWPKGKTTHEFIDELMEDIVGFDGPNQGNLTDEAFGPICTTWDGTQTLNSAKYSRYYSHKKKDAMGRTGKKRAFNDLLFAAQTTNKRVSPMTVCTEVSSDDMTDPGDATRENQCKAIKDEDACNENRKWEANELGNNAIEAKCHWKKKKCVYKKCWEQRWTYAMPLEIVFQTPLTEWNPYNINYYDRYNVNYDVTAGGRTGKKGSAFKGTNQGSFYRTPASFFKDPKNVDPADTSGSTTYVEDNGGTERQVRASGHWILTPEIEGIGQLRQRYPIFPVHEHGSTIWKETKAIEELIMGSSKKEIRNIIAETRAEAYGTELRLIVGGGHSHQIHISPAEVIKLTTGVITEISKTSTEANAHTHRVMVCIFF